MGRTENRGEISPPRVFPWGRISPFRMSKTHVSNHTRLNASSHLVTSQIAFYLTTIIVLMNCISPDKLALVLKQNWNKEESPSWRKKIKLSWRRYQKFWIAPLFPPYSWQLSLSPLIETHNSPWSNTFLWHFVLLKWCCNFYMLRAIAKIMPKPFFRLDWLVNHMENWFFSWVQDSQFCYFSVETPSVCEISICLCIAELCVEMFAWSHNFCLCWFCTFLFRSSSTIKLFLHFRISWLIIIRKASRRKHAGPYQISQLGIKSRFRWISLCVFIVL